MVRQRKRIGSSIPAAGPYGAKLDRPAPVSPEHNNVPIDKTDREIDRALREGRPIDLEKAFPTPAPGVRTRTRAVPPERAYQRSPEDQRLLEEHRTPPSAPSRPSPGTPASALAENPAERWRAVESMGPAYAKEYRLRLVHRLLLRGLSLDVIARQINIDLMTVAKMRKELNERLKAESRKIDTALFFAKTDAFYTEIRSMAMRMADDVGTPTRPSTKTDRLNAMRLALNAEADRQRFYHVAGVFAAQPFSTGGATAAEEAHRDASKIIDMVKAIASGDDLEGVFVVAEDKADDEDNIELLG